MAAIRKRRGFLYGATLVSALVLCGAFALVRRAEHFGHVPPPAVLAERSKAVSVQTQAATATPEVASRGVRFELLAEIGRGMGVIFSPDFSAPANRRFYERLGFAYFESADWRDLLAQVRAYNRAHPGRQIETLILEVHGTNGHGLKLQASSAPRVPRSYISVGGLQQQLADAGLRLCVIAACNSGRLFRPEIYYALNTRTGDPLFLPATLGVVNAAPGFRATERDMRVVYPATSQLEAVNEGHLSEFAPRTVALLNGDAKAGTTDGTKVTADARFVVSDTLLALLLDDPRLRLTADGYVAEMSSATSSPAESESLVQRFIALVDEVAAREYSAAHDGEGGG
ncbi:MAG TPA: hypothetical protein VF656_08100 [Pyrinomonadaceae bacterium]